MAAIRPLQQYDLCSPTLFILTTSDTFIYTGSNVDNTIEWLCDHESTRHIAWPACGSRRVRWPAFSDHRVTWYIMWPACSNDGITSPRVPFHWPITLKTSSTFQFLQLSSSIISFLKKCGANLFLFHTHNQLYFMNIFIHLPYSFKHRMGKCVCVGGTAILANQFCGDVGLWPVTQVGVNAAVTDSCVSASDTSRQSWWADRSESLRR